MKVGLALLTCREIRLRKIERLTAYTFWSCLSLCHLVTQYLIKGLLAPVEFHQRFSALTSHLHIWLPSRGPALVLYPAECNQCSSPLVFYCLFLVCAWQDANAPGSTIELSKMQMSSVCVFFSSLLVGFSIDSHPQATLGLIVLTSKTKSKPQPFPCVWAWVNWNHSQREGSMSHNTQSN